MISQRLRLARQANCLSLQQVADRMAKLSMPITRATLSNYENGKTPISDSVLSVLAAALGMRKDFFTEVAHEDIDIVFYSRLDSFASSRVNELKSYIQIILERRNYIDQILGAKKQLSCIEKTTVSIHNPETIGHVCQKLRTYWSLGQCALPSICHLLEQHGWLLAILPDFFPQTRVSGCENSKGTHFIFFSFSPYPDVLRSTLLQELGRTLFSFFPDEEDEVLSYFSRELLFPQKNVLEEFGHRRTHIAETELDRIKNIYGLPRREIMLRLREVGIISEVYYNDFLIYKNQDTVLYDLSSPMGFCELPTFHQAKVAKAKAEGLLPDDYDKFFS